MLASRIQGFKVLRRLGSEFLGLGGLEALGTFMLWLVARCFALTLLSLRVEGLQVQGL